VKGRAIWKLHCAVRGFCMRAIRLRRSDALRGVRLQR